MHNDWHLVVQVHDYPDLSDNPPRYRRWGQRRYLTEDTAWEAAYEARAELARRGTRSFSSGHRTRYFGSIRPELRSTS